MVSQLQKPTESEIIYPDSDGQPMADNTIQFRWIMHIHYNLAWLFAKDENVFVAGDLLWYPVENNNKIRQAPDVMVAFGVKKGDRGSYKQWIENKIAPQVVFEILSPGNTLIEMAKKLRFYDRYQVEEYYLYDPQKNDLTGWIREDSDLNVIEDIDGWVSPRLKIIFDLSGDELQLKYPDGQPFGDFTEIKAELQQTTQQLGETKQQLQDTTEQLQQAVERANLREQELIIERQKFQKLAQLLQQKGVNLEEINNHE